MLLTAPRGKRTSLLYTGTDKRSSLGSNDAWRLSSASMGAYSDGHRSSRYGSPGTEHQSSLIPSTDPRSKHPKGAPGDAPSTPPGPPYSRLSASNLHQHNVPTVLPSPAVPHIVPNPFGMPLAMGAGMPMGMPIAPSMVVMQPVFMLPPPSVNGGFPWMQSPGISGRSPAPTSTAGTPAPPPGSPGKN